MLLFLHDITDDVDRVAAPRQATERTGASRRARSASQGARKRRPCEIVLAPALQDVLDGRIDDAIGETPTNQFSRHAQAPVSPAQKKLLGTPARQRAIVYIAEIAERLKGVARERGGHAAPVEEARDFGSRARGAREIAARQCPGRLGGRNRRSGGVRSGRS